MISGRLQNPTARDLDAQVGERLDSDPASELIVQFSRSDSYDDDLLGRLDRLCARYGKRLQVRFYSHYPNDRFDGRVLRRLPNVMALTLDCQDDASNLRELGTLEHLREFALQIHKGDEPDILALPAFANLQELRISQDSGPPVDLAPISAMPHLHTLSISVQSLNLSALARHAGIRTLHLHRLPAKVSLEMVATLPALQQLAVGFGSRDTMPELHHATVRRLEIVRVRGLNALDLSNFPALETLSIEDQAQLGELNLSSTPGLQRLQIDNCKTLCALHGLHESQLHDLRLSRTPALDVLHLLQHELPTALNTLRCWTGKRKLDHEIEQVQQRLGLPSPQSPF